MPEPLNGIAYAKLNFGLIVGARDGDGYHPIISLVQSVSWADRLSLAASDTDDFQAVGIAAEEDNLAWRAVTAVRREAGASQPVSVRLEKQVAVAAGLGGGSADAAAGLGIAARFFGFPEGSLPDLAEGLGSDVPFCLSGGLAIVEGRGELITPQSGPATDYVVAIVVPPLELPTADVYAEWDRLGSPEGEAVSASAMPPSLRGFAPLRNDLQPAARSLQPMVSDWQDEVMSSWARPVLMTGSGPALFGFFLDAEEAAAALDAVPPGGRALQIAGPVARGWEMSSGTLAGPN